MPSVYSPVHHTILVLNLAAHFTSMCCASHMFLVVQLVCFVLCAPSQHRQHQCTTRGANPMTNVHDVSMDLEAGATMEKVRTRIDDINSTIDNFQSHKIWAR